ncbi:MAG TPA: DUF4012 domain-containing protein [Candidatus Fimivivens sp.]|nr:DUF4012 domain-containing protein [Candidatus Fimivivens sp.]
MTDKRKETKRHSLRNGFLLAILSALFLTFGYLYWEVRDHGSGLVGEITDLLPVPTWAQDGSSVLTILTNTLLRADGRERTYLILFQNNLELRPTGGFIGSFGILKVKDRHMTGLTTFDTGTFDTRIPDTVVPPEPIADALHEPSWKLRDSNWEPDFPIVAGQAVRFYEMGGGQERFDGVIGITADVLSSFLTVTGPVEVPGFPGSYGSDDAVLDLERQVEQGYIDQNIDFSERKSVLGLLARQIINKVKSLPPQELPHLFRVVVDDLDRKDIQLSFSHDSLRHAVRDAGWDGAFDTSWSGDFVEAVDANLGAWKTDSVMKRSMDYEVDLSRDRPRARLAIRYENTATEKTFMVRDYRTFLRVYVPGGTDFRSISGNASDPMYGTFMGRKYAGLFVEVPLGTSKDVVFEYDLPQRIADCPYTLKIARQAGTGDIPVAITITGKDGSSRNEHALLNRDFTLGHSPE